MRQHRRGVSAANRLAIGLADAAQRALQVLRRAMVVINVLDLSKSDAGELRRS